MPKIKKMLSWIVAFAILLSALAPGGMAVTVRAETSVESSQPDLPPEEIPSSPSSDTDTELAPDTVTVTFTAENGVITNNAGVPMLETLVVAPGKAIPFTVVSATAYAMTCVTANGVSVPINAQGYYSVDVTEDIQIHAVCNALNNQPIRVSRQESGWAPFATYEITISEEIAAASVRFISDFGTTPALAQNEDGTYTATITANGTYALYVEDINGFGAITHIAETQVDCNKPVINELNRLTSEDGWVEQIEYALTVSDAESRIAAVVLKNAEDGETALTANAEGVFLFCIRAGESYELVIVDHAGNTYSQQIMAGEKDITAPQLKDLLRSTSGWYSGTVAYTFTVEETQSGIASVSYTIDGAQQTVLVPNDNGVYSISVDGNCTMYITTADSMGNTMQFVIAENQIDTEAPVVSALAREQEGWCQSTRYNFSATDDTSGIAALYLIDPAQNEVLLNPDEEGQYTVQIVTNGIYTIRVVDNAGNVTEAAFEESEIDTTAPTVLDMCRTESGWAKMAFYNFRVEETQSGVKGVYVAVGRSDFEEIKAIDGLYCFCVAENVPFMIRVEDNAGNLDTYQGTENEIDIDAPIISAVIRTENGWAQCTNYSFTVTDILSGVASVTVSSEGTDTQLTADSQGTYTFAVTENGTYTITAVDTLGNTSTNTVSEEQIDTIAPFIDGLNRHAENWQYEVQYSFEVIEQESGVAEVLILDAAGAEIPYTQIEDQYIFMLTYNTAFSICVTDVAGNTSQFQAEESEIDREIPVLTEVQRNTDAWTDAAVYTFSATDALSGVASVIWTAEDGTQYELLADGGNYTVTVTANGVYTLTVTDLTGNAVTQTIVEALVDTTAPDITELTRAEAGWATMTTYTFRASDTQSGITSVTVTIGNDAPMVLIGTEGMYTFAVNNNTSFEICVTDAVGNKYCIGGKEEKIDITNPTMSELERSAEGWLAFVTYTFTANDAQSGIQSVTVTNADGNTSELFSDGSGQYVFDVNKSGTYILIVTDNVGNMTTYICEETLVDIEAPTIVDVIRDPEQWAQNALFTFRVTDTHSGVASVKVYMDNIEQELLCNTEGQYSFTALANGSYKIVAADMAGNTNSVVVNETNIDLTAPVIHSIQPQTGWDAQENTVIFTVTDESALSLVYVMDKAETRCYELTKQENNRYELILHINGEYTVIAMDEAGNSVSADFVVSHIDTEKPTVPILSGSAQGWTNQNVTVQAVADDTQSGIVRYWYSCDSNIFDASTWYPMEFNNGIGSITLTAEQDTDYFVVAEDGVGRISEVSTIHVSIDKTAPADLLVQFVMGEGSGYHGTDASGRAIYKDILTFCAAASDPASGVCAYRYRIVDSEGQQSAWVGIEAGEEGISPAITELPDGIYTVYVVVYDAAGNCSEEIQLTHNGENADFVLENTPAEDAQRYPCPDVTMLAGGEKYDGEWINETVTIHISGSHAVSGIHHYEYRIDYADPVAEDTQWEVVPVADSVAQLAVAQDTNATYYFRAVTYAGNITQETNRIVKVQKTMPPMGTITPEQATGANGWYTKLPGYGTTLPEQNPYMAPIRYYFDYTHDGEEETVSVITGTDVKIDTDGIWTMRIVTTDLAGNKVVSAPCTFMVDTKVPDKLDVTLNGVSILNGSEQPSQWDAVNTTDRIVFTDFDLFQNHDVPLRICADGGDSGMAAMFYMAVPYNEQFAKDGDWTLLDGDSVILSADGKYHLFFKAVDKAGNTTYFSAGSVIVDATAPVGMDSDPMTVVADTSNMTAYGYYNSDVTYEVHVRERQHGEAAVFSGLKSIQYRVLANGTVTQSGQLYPGSGAEGYTEGRVSAWDGMVVIDAENSNYDGVVLEIIATDMSGNARVTKAKPVNIDVVAPVVDGSFDKNSTFTQFEGVSCFYGDRTLTVICTEKNFVAARSLIYVRETDNDTLLPVQWISDGMTHTAVIPITEDGHYEVSARITDAAGNVTDAINFTEFTVAADKFILDSTAPVITVTHANNDAQNSKYFAGDRTVVISVEERNFVPELMSIKMVVKTEDGRTMILPDPEWSTTGTTHTATITFEEEGQYQFLVNGMDAVCNHATDISYIGTAVKDWVIDKNIEKPVFEYVTNGGEYNYAVAPVITALDENVDTLTVRLYHTSMEFKDKDVTDTYLTSATISRKEIENGIELTLDIFPGLHEYDGLYTLIATSVDLAGNTAESKIGFTINRFGSVYAYDEALLALMGTSMKQMSTDIIITEINPSAVLDGSAQVFITNDGMPIINPKFAVETVDSGSGWYKYRYVIYKDNFTADGTYKVILSTKDAAGNIPENTAEGYAITFSIDNEAPVLTSILGMEQPIIKANTQKVTLVAMDNVQLSEITVYINGEQIACWDNIGNYEGEYTFEIPEILEGHVRIVVTDEAGNVLDTDDDSFAPGYGFHREITVSSNFFLRFYANKPFFFGAMGTIGAVIGTIFTVLFRKKKKEKTN